ncbi:MAG TPA: type IV pilus secretin PilQ [Thermoanaerobaculia bacterium]|nr:type IV pilus secretin PilQ [Thermoanaerobaculia bacterium]
MVNLRSSRKTLLLVAVTGVAVLGLSCASAPPAAQSASGTRAVSAAAREGLTLLEIRAENAPAPRLVVRTSSKPAYTSYSPQPDVFVLDLARTSKSAALTIPGDLPANLASVSADEVVELGNPITRVTVRFKSAVAPTATASDDSVILSFAPAAVAERSSEIVPEVAVMAVPEIEEPSVSAELIAEPIDEPIVKARNENRSMSAPAGSGSARSLRGIRTVGSGSDVAVVLESDGSSVEFSSFRLTKPDRIVVDLKGVKNAVSKSRFDVSGSAVKAVRVSQFEMRPRPITRVVVDMSRFSEYEIVDRDGKLSVEFGTPGSLHRTLVADSQAGSERRKPVPQVKQVVPARSAEPAATWPDVPQQVAVVAQPAARESRGSQPKVATHVVNSAEAQTSPQTPTARPSTENVFLDQQTSSTSSLGTRVTPGESRTLSAGERNYTGDPIDLRLKDADIKDVLRTFAQLTGLNIAIDPGVTGQVTVEFTQVPWDQALELILRQNGLNYDLQGSVMRIGTLERLAAEQASTRRLEEDQSLNVPLQTVIKHLSYAKADAVQGLLREMASPRGKMVVDTRTNQLVITEIPRYLQTMLNLIETIDIPTPQVVIEARIVETTKNFLQQYGVNFGFRGSLDPALGTGTGLIFPSQVGVVGGPFNFGPGNPILNLTLSNVLGTFDLDVALNAAESEGLARIVSAPKVTTQDNQAAEIQSGVQIPIQTRVNFTTTIQYIDATLRLSVTPQVTAQDTVIMDISVQKVEPIAGIAIAGGGNTPLATRRATTRLMVRDGGTTVIGGIYQSSENDSVSRLPFLHRIPILGHLFRTHDISSRHDELLIFITPRIIRNT